MVVTLSVLPPAFLVNISQCRTLLCREVPVWTTTQDQRTIRVMLTGSSSLHWRSPASSSKAALRGGDRLECRVARPSIYLNSRNNETPVASTSQLLRPRAIHNVDALRSMDAPVSTAVQNSFDEGDDIGWTPGEVFEISSVSQLQEMVKGHSTQKVILMCKSRACRPCKAFTLTYKRFASKFEDVVFLSVIGEQSAELRDMMIALNIRQTPSFLCFYDGAIVHRHKGNNKERMEELLTCDWAALKDSLSKPDAGDAFLGLS
eukprot:jgi/Ulvmu1/2201/UM013_0047.1